MPRMSYEYGTSPRKYDIDYDEPKRKNKKTTGKRKTNVKNTPKNKEAKSEVLKNIKKKKQEKLQERKSKTLQVVVVLALFGMLLALSYREISIMEVFNQKKSLENKLAVIQKENGQVEKNIREVESKLDWNKIKNIATEQLGMQVKTGKPIDLGKVDNVETKTEFIIKEEESFLDKIIEYILDLKKN